MGWNNAGFATLTPGWSLFQLVTQRNPRQQMVSNALNVSLSHIPLSWRSDTMFLNDIIRPSTFSWPPSLWARRWAWDHLVGWEMGQTIWEAVALYLYKYCFLSQSRCVAQHTNTSWVCEGKGCPLFMSDESTAHEPKVRVHLRSLNENAVLAPGEQQRQQLVVKLMLCGHNTQWRSYTIRVRFGDG